MSNYIKSIALRSKIKDVSKHQEERLRLEEENSRKCLEDDIKNKTILKLNLIKQQEEAIRMEEDANRKRLEEAIRKHMDDENNIIQLEEANKRQLEEEEANRKRLEEEEANRKRLEEEESNKKLLEEANKKRLEEEANRKRLEEEANRKRLEEEFNKKRLEEEDNAKKIFEAELKKQEQENKSSIESHKKELDDAKRKELEAKIQAEEAKRQLSELRNYYEEQINKNNKLINKFKNVDDMKKKELEDLIQKAKEAEEVAKKDADGLAKKAEELSEKVTELIKKEKEEIINKKIYKFNSEINELIGELKNLKYNELKNKEKINEYNMTISTIEKEIKEDSNNLENFIIEKNKKAIEDQNKTLELEKILIQSTEQKKETEQKIYQINKLITELDDSLKTLKLVENNIKNEEIEFKIKSNNKIKNLTENIEKKGFILLDLDKKIKENTESINNIEEKLNNFIKESDIIASNINQILDISEKIKKMEELSSVAIKIKEYQKNFEDTSKILSNIKSIYEEEHTCKNSLELSKKNSEDTYIQEQDNYNNKIKKAEESTNNTELILIKTKLDCQELIKEYDNFDLKEKENQCNLISFKEESTKNLSKISMEEVSIKDNIETKKGKIHKYNIENNALVEECGDLTKKMKDLNDNILALNNNLYNLYLELNDLLDDKILSLTNKNSKNESLKNSYILNLENDKKAQNILNENYKKIFNEKKENQKLKENLDINLLEYLKFEKDYINNINNSADKILKFNNLSDKLNVLNNINNTIKQAEVIYNKKVDTQNKIKQIEDLLNNQNTFLVNTEKEIKEIITKIEKNEVDLTNIQVELVNINEINQIEKNKKLEIDTKILNNGNLNVEILKIFELEKIPEGVVFDKKQSDENVKLNKEYSELIEIFSNFKSCDFNGHLIYNTKDDLLDFIKQNKNTGDIERILNNYNRINVDTKVFKYCNKYYDDQNLLSKILNDFVNDGCVYSLSQIENYFDRKFMFFIKDDKLYLEFNEKLYDLIDVTNYIYTMSYEDLINDIIIKENYINTPSDTVYCCYIGSYDLGLQLLQKLFVKNKEMVCFVIKSYKLYKELIPIIQDKFSNYILFISKEYGSDIIPTLQSLNYLLNNYEIKYIYKFHTKGDSKIFNELTDYLLKITKSDIISQLNYNVSNCLTKKEYMKPIKHDVFNKKLIKEYLGSINPNLSFALSTIFVCESNLILKILDFIKNNNFRQYFINNLYDTNMILYKNSPIHFIERLFGIIKL